MERILFRLVNGLAGGYSGAMDASAENPQGSPLRRTGPEELPADAAAAGSALPLAIAAWTLADPGVAARLVEAWLATADEAGNLTPACPAVCQLAERAADALPDSDSFVERILPALARCAEREFDRYDEAGTGLPRWPSAAEALFPAEFAEGRFTVDLAVLLSNEALAFGRLAAGKEAAFARALDAVDGERRELDDWLKETFWDEEAAAFHRHDPGRESAPDFSPCGFFPLAWEGRTDEMSESLRGRAGEWPAGAWTPRGWILLFALLMRTPHNSVVAKMRRDGLPPGASPAEKAAWAALAAGADAARAPYVGHVPPSARWLDAHGRGIARGLLAGAATLLVVLLGWWIYHRENSGTEAAPETERRARAACAEGEHARAAALYGQAARRNPGDYFAYRQAGEWMHLERFADAEGAYRAMLARDPGAHNARLNLALAVWKQGRRDEARDLYRAVAEGAATANPELAARARLAAELVEKQIALDAPPPLGQ